MNDVMVVGAGVAGLAAAQALTLAGLKVCVLEKSRGIGGRLATRRVTTPNGEVPVDHGAQFFTCRSPQFQAVLTPLLNQGTVSIWLETIPTLKPEGIVPADAAHTYPRYCCPEGMTALAKVLATGLTIQRETKVTDLTITTDACWRARTGAGEEFTARALILTPPPPQSLALVDSLAAEIDELAVVREVQLDPCLAVMAGYSPQADHLDRMPLGLRWQDDAVIAWSAVDSSKRPHPPAPVLVLHTTPQFARHHAAGDRQQLITQVLDHATAQLQPHLYLDLRSPEWSQAHYWRYAQPVNPLQRQWIGSPVPAPLVLAGCWCSAGRVEGAFLSGQAAAQGLLASKWLG